MLLLLAVDWQASALRDEEAGCFCKVAGMFIVAVGGPRLRQTWEHSLHSDGCYLVYRGNTTLPRHRSRVPASAFSKVVV